MKQMPEMQLIAFFQCRTLRLGFMMDLEESFTFKLGSFCETVLNKFGTLGSLCSGGKWS